MSEANMSGQIFRDSAADRSFRHRGRVLGVGGGIGVLGDGAGTTAQVRQLTLHLFRKYPRRRHPLPAKAASGGDIFQTDEEG